MLIFITLFRDDVVVNRAVLLPTAIAKAPEGEGCPKCGGYVYAAEQMLARGRVSMLAILLVYTQWSNYHYY